MATERQAEMAARIRRQHPLWSVRRVEPGRGTGWTAQRGERRVWAPTIALMEAALLDIKRGRDPEAPERRVGPHLSGDRKGPTRPPHRQSEGRR